MASDSPVEIRWKASQGIVPKKKLSKHRKNGSLTINDEEERYYFLNKIHVSEISGVYLGLDSKHKRKVILKNSGKLTFFKSEVAAMTRLCHKGVCTLLDFHFRGETPFLVYEYIKGEDLIDWCNTYHSTKHTATDIEDTVRPIAKQVIKALGYCHSQGVAHRDVKIDNIRIDPKTRKIKLIDFGFAYVCDYNIDQKTQCGSKEWAAPEIFFKDCIDPFKSDVWAIGILVYVLAHSCYPFLKNDYKGNIKLDRVRRIFSSELKKAFKTLCTKDVEKRLTMNEVLTLDWFTVFSN
jgi:serine/threonine protein kinase